MATVTASKGSKGSSERFGANELAEHLGTSGHTLRAFIRGMGDSSLPVGRGGRYEWSGKGDPAVKRIVAAWKKAQAEAAAE